MADRTLTSLPRAKTGPLRARQSRDGCGAKTGSEGGRCSGVMGEAHCVTMPSLLYFKSRSFGLSS